MSALDTAAEPIEAPVVLDLIGERAPMKDLVRELIKRRGLLPMLAERDFRARYRSTTLGLVWAVLLPLLQGAIIAAVFSRLVKFHTAANYPIFVLVGMTTWTYLTTSVNAATTSIVDQSDIAARVYFPRLFLPGMNLLAGVPGLSAGFLVIIPIGAAFFGVYPTWHMVALPLVPIFAAAVVYAVGAPLALLNVYFRDVRYFVLASLQALLYATPVIYPMTELGRYQNLMCINPGTGVVELARWSFKANGADPLLLPVLGTLAWIVVLGFASLIAYSRHERLACDRL